MTDNVLDISTRKPLVKRKRAKQNKISLEMKRLEGFAREYKIKSYAIVMIAEDGEIIIGHDAEESHSSKVATGLWSLFNEMSERALGFEDLDDLDESDYVD